MLRTLKRKILEPIQDRVFEQVMEYLMKPAKARGGRILFGAEELKLLRRALISQNLCCVDGKMVPALEREFAVAYGVPYAVASTSGTAAIHVALGALDLNPGDEVITAPITDLGTIIPILYQNAIPVFADIDDTYNMDPADVERKITPRTRAIIVVHLFGNPCDMDAMVSIARRHNIPLIEDCAQAHMAQYKGRYVGTIGDIGCFSFQQSKHMTTGDGGMTITGNKAYYERMKLFADKGYARKGWGARAYLFHAPNYRMTELVGAVGLAQLKKVKGVVEKRRELGLYMTELLGAIDGVRTAPVTPGATHAFWLYPMGVDGVDVTALAQEVRKDNVWVSAGYTGKPIYLCTESLTAKKTYGSSGCPFTCGHASGSYEYEEGLCPRAEEALKHLICIPIDESWKKEDVTRVAGVIAKCMEAIRKHDGITSTTSTSLPTKKAPKGERSSVGSNGEGKVRIGIIGCGQMGRWHLDSYKRNPHAHVVAVADTDFEKAQTFAREVGARAYRSHQEMFAEEKLTGVSVCTVPSTHKEIALDALDAGINVLCEKPLAISVSQAMEMSERARAKNLLMLTAFKFRFFDEVLRAKDLVDKGSLGNILGFRLMFGGYMDMTGTWYSRKELSGGGIIMDNGPHAFDLIRFLFGEIRSVVAHAASHQNLGVEDTAQLSVHLESGTVGTVDLSWSSSVPASAYLEIYGEDGAAMLDHGGISYKFKTWNDWQRVPNSVDAQAAFARQIDHFVEAITGKSPHRLSNLEGLKSQAVIEAAYDSLKQDRKIDVLN